MEIDDRLLYGYTSRRRHCLRTLSERRQIRSITGKTKARDRLSLIDQFRKGEISVLCNHSVLTVGFDAPNTDVIYVTRPVYSPIMLEQIVGRGLRGEKFGGTAECLVVTPQEMLVLEQAFGENIVLAEDEIKKRLFIED